MLTIASVCSFAASLIASSVGRISPELPPPAQVEYTGEDVVEAADPSRQEEEEYEAKQAEEEEGEDDDEDDEDED